MQANDIQQTRDDIRRLLEQDLSAVALDVPPAASPEALYETAAAARWLSGVRGKTGALRHPRAALYHAGDAGAARLAAVQPGRDPVSMLALDINADLQVYDLSGGNDGADAATLLHALTYGMMAVQPGLDVLAVACLDDRTVDGGPLTLDRLLDSGRADMAALCGTLIAARLARLPVVTGGHAATQVAGILRGAAAGAGDHILSAHNLLPTGGDTHADGARDALMAIAYLKAIAIGH